MRHLICFQDCCEKEWSLAKYHPTCRDEGKKGPTCPKGDEFDDCCLDDPVASSWTYKARSTQVDTPADSPSSAPRLVILWWAAMAMTIGSAWMLV